MIFLTGDTHGMTDWHKLSTRQFPLQKQLTRDDFVIICGDFGGVWAGPDSRQDRYVLDWYEEKPFTTLFVDGNHENHPLLASYPEENWMGGRIHRIRPNVIHLMRGEIYTLDGKKFFAFGGAPSVDKKYRVQGVSWWPEEVASPEEIERARQNLDRVGWKVDYVVTHTIWNTLIAQLGTLLSKKPVPNPTEDFLEEVRYKLDYQWWFAGHFHLDRMIASEKCCLLYDQVVQLAPGLPVVNQEEA